VALSGTHLYDRPFPSRARSDGGAADRTRPRSRNSIVRQPGHMTANPHGPVFVLRATPTIASIPAVSSFSEPFGAQCPAKDSFSPLEFRGCFLRFATGAAEAASTAVGALALASAAAAGTRELILFAPHVAGDVTFARCCRSM
jgi:hypothetical protein